MGRTGHLLLELALELAAHVFSSGICGLRDLGALAFAPAAHVHSLPRFVSWRRGMVDRDSSIAQSPLAAGSCGDAEGDD